MKTIRVLNPESMKEEASILTETLDRDNISGYEHIPSLLQCNKYLFYFKRIYTGKLLYPEVEEQDSVYSFLQLFVLNIETSEEKLFPNYNFNEEFGFYTVKFNRDFGNSFLIYSDNETINKKVYSTLEQAKKAALEILNSKS